MNTFNDNIEILKVYDYKSIIVRISENSKEEFRDY